MRIILCLTEINQKFGALNSQHGLASISAVLKKNGFTDVRLAHFSTQRDVSQWPQYLKNTAPDVVAFYTAAEQMVSIGNLISQVPPGIFTICGGPHATCFPNFIEEIARLDALCIGEGEEAMLELVTTLKEGGDPSHIKNLWVRHNGQIIKNETRSFISDLNELPHEDRGLFDTQKAIDNYGLRQIRVMTTRGCPYQCTYCSNKRISQTQNGRYLRFRSADHILSELLVLKNRFKFDEIFFDDDIFMIDKKIREEFCARYLLEIGKPFVFCGRVEMCAPDMLNSLKKAGGRRIDFGLESGSEHIRRYVLKRFMTNEAIIKATRMAKEAGLQVKTLNMIGLPDETMETHMDTVRLNREIQPDVISSSIFSPYPGTEIYNYCIEQKYFNPDTPLPKGYVSRRQSTLTMPNFSSRDIEKCFKRFAFRVFKGYSKVKAVGYLVLYSSYGEFALNISSHIREFFKGVLRGF